MAWIRVETRIVRSRKVGRLARTLEISPREARGLLVDLWTWALEEVPDGDLSELDAEDIAHGALWDRDAGELWAALLDAGLVNECEQLHDWQEHQSASLDQLARSEGAS